MKLSADPKKWKVSLLKEEHNFVKTEYVKNIKEQVINYNRKHQKLPEDFYDLQKPAQLKEKILTYAPDDKQAIKITAEEEKIKLSFKVIDYENNKIKWKWIDTTIEIPPFLRDKQITPPDLRLDCIRGDWFPVLDFKITIPKTKSK